MSYVKMTRTEYIEHTLHSLCGDKPASPDVYYQVERMADNVSAVYPFDKETEGNTNT